MVTDKDPTVLPGIKSRIKDSRRGWVPPRVPSGGDRPKSILGYRCSVTYWESLDNNRHTLEVPTPSLKGTFILRFRSPF